MCLVNGGVVLFFFKNALLMSKGWVSSFLQQKAGNHNFRNSIV
jgi:hypothetical protein